MTPHFVVVVQLLRYRARTELTAAGQEHFELVVVDPVGNIDSSSIRSISPDQHDTASSWSLCFAVRKAEVKQTLWRAAH